MAKGISTYYGQQYLTPVYPNLLLNSDMYRWQRGIDTTVDNDYGPDRMVARSVDQTGVTINTVRLRQNADKPYGVGARGSCLVTANGTSTRLGIGQRVENRELEAYRGQMMKLSIYVKRIATLPNSNIQLAFQEGSGENLYTTSYVSDMTEVIYDDSFNNLATGGYTRISGDVLITDSMVTNGICVGVKVKNPGETVNEITGDLMYITAIMLNRSDVLTPYTKAHAMTGIEDMALFRYFCKSYNMEDAPGIQTTNGMEYFANQTSDSMSRRPIKFKNTMRGTPTVVTYATQGAIAPDTVYAGGTILSCTSRWLSDNGGSVGWSSGAYNVQMQWTADAEIR